MGPTFVMAVSMEASEIYKVESTRFGKYVRSMREEKAVKRDPKVSNLRSWVKRKLYSIPKEEYIWIRKIMNSFLDTFEVS